MPAERFPERDEVRPTSLRQSLFTISWVEHDTVRDLTLITLVAYGIAAALAIFGLPPVSLHGPLHFVGIMDPLCGMTRAVRFLALGDVGNAIRYNPASALLAILTVGILVRAAIGAWSGRWLIVHVQRSRSVLALSMFLIAAIWINQQAHATLLM